MEGLVNYSSEEEQDDYPHTKVATRERGGGATNTGRAAAATDASGSIKRTYHSKSGSSERDASPYRKGRDAGGERYKSGNSNYNEDKYKIDRRTDKSRDYRDKRDNREPRNNRDTREEGRDYDSSHKYDYKKHDDHKRYRDSKRDYKRDGNDYHRDDKRFNRYDERKSTYNPNYKDRFNNSKSRYDERKSNEEQRFNDDRRGGSNTDERRRDFNDKRNYNNDDDRKVERRNNEDRRSQRSYNDDRSSNAYRPRRSNSPAPSQRNNSSNKYSERKDESNARRERKRHSRSRSRSRSNSADNSADTNLAINKNLSQNIAELKRPEGEITHVSEKKSLPTARNFEALLSLPLTENAPKQNNAVTVPAISAMPGLNLTTASVQLPSYYNPNVINPNKYVEQMQKRKLIWGAKKVEDSASKWGHAQFSQDQDGKVASKFMRLMGIKSAGGSAESSNPNESEKKSTTPPTSTDVKSREAMFSTMEQQYEVARQVTHTMRGVGLGFGSQSRPY